MPARAIRGKNPWALLFPQDEGKKHEANVSLTRPPTGVLVECDPSIKSIIVNIDTKSGHEYIIDDLDDEHVVIKETMLQKLKQMLEDRLRETTQQHGGDESGSE